MSIAALSVSNTGLQAADAYLNNTSNNIANSNTVGYKSSQISFQDLFYSAANTGPTTTGITPPGGSQLGYGVATAATTPNLAQGTIATSSGPLDVAINGQGYFAVNLPNGQTGYTRAGNFSLDSAGNIVTSDGFILAGGIRLPAGASSVAISVTGLVTATAANGSTLTLGQLQLTQFQNPQGLERIGDTTFTVSPASGTATTGDPGSGAFGTLEQGSLEQSNVNISTELINLIVAQQTFNSNVNALTVENEVLQDTTQLITATG